MTHLNLVKPPPLIDVPDTSYLQLLQKEFHKTFEIPINSSTEEVYARLIEEEHEEWIEECFSENSNAYDELKELTDLLYVTCGYAHQLGYNNIKPIKCNLKDDWDWAITEYVGDIAAGNKSKDTLAKLMYCIYGYADYMSWDIREAYIRVHRSNMTKLTADGKVLRREDGKVLKSELYQPPILTDLTGGL